MEFWIGIILDTICLAIALFAWRSTQKDLQEA